MVGHFESAGTPSHEDLQEVVPAGLGPGERAADHPAGGTEPACHVVGPHARRGPCPAVPTRACGSPIDRAPARLDLHHDEHAAFPRDDVDLRLGGPNVAADAAEPGVHENPRGQFLTEGAHLGLGEASADETTVQRAAQSEVGAVLNPRRQQRAPGSPQAPSEGLNRGLPGRSFPPRVRP